jgi:DNA-binding GntR family transcriptional regulator
LDWLDQARILVRQQGRGTFVRDQNAAETGGRYEKLCNHNGSAFTDHIEHVGVAEAVADDEECEKLAIPRGALVWRIDCLRTLERRPHILERSSVPRSLIPTCGSVKYSLAELAGAYGLLLGQASERVCIGTPPDWAAERMGIATDTPLLVLDRIIQTVQGTAIEWRKCYCVTAGAQYSALIG